MITAIQESIDVDVSVRDAYEQWSRFEEFPEFMESVVEVDELDERRTRWVTEIAGITRGFEAEIVEQTPFQRIAWSSVDGPHQGGVVTFHELSDHTTRVMYQMDFEPEGIAERAGAITGLVARQIRQDLEAFKEYVEGSSWR